MRIVTTALIGCLVLALQTVAANAATYRVMNISGQNMNSIDSDSIKRDGAMARVWMQTEYWQPQGSQKPYYQRTKSLMEIDCKESRNRILSFITFNESYEITGSVDIPTTWQFIVSDSWFRKVEQAVCENKFDAVADMKFEDYREMVTINRMVKDQVYSKRVK